MKQQQRLDIKFLFQLERSQTAEKKKVLQKKIKVFLRPHLANKQTNGLESFLIIYPRLLLTHPLILLLQSVSGIQTEPWFSCHF